MKWSGLIFLLGCVNGYIKSPQSANEPPEAYCSSQPTRAKKALCEQIEQWNVAAENAKLEPKPPPAPPVYTESITGPKPCDDFHCLCKLSGGSWTQRGMCEKRGRRFQFLKAERKEYRMLTDDERNRFHDAVKQLHSKGIYNEMVRNHHQNVAYGAHGGAAFLPWHREFVKQFEFALRTIDPSLSVPYWDSSLDEPLPVSADSVLWTDEFLGKTDHAGNVISGPFSPWRCTNSFHYIQRDVGGYERFGATLFTSRHLSEIQNRQTYTELARCPVTRDYDGFEMTHGLGHLWVGGHMYNTSVSPNDPSFFLHHAFVDFLWEEWRIKNQRRSVRESEYPSCCKKVAWREDICDSDHGPDAPMEPFVTKRNRDGLSNHYTDTLYSYASRPSCDWQRQDCGSKYLFCDTRHGQPTCVSKVRVGGFCAGFEGQSICHMGECVNGKCEARYPPVRSTLKPTIPPPQDRCYNEHECCDVWAQGGHCSLNSRMHTSCKPACRLCTPRYNKQGCVDYHYECLDRVRRGQCQTNPDWMAENCRFSCGLCQQHKCGGAPAQSSVHGLPVPVPHSQHSPKCEPGWQLYVGHCYKSFTQAKTWEDARADCSRVALGAQLVQNGPRVVGYWLGARRDKQDSEKIVSLPSQSQEIVFDNFARGEPNNGLVKGPDCFTYWYDHENCVEMYAAPTDKGQWNDAKCRERKPYMCKAYELGTRKRTK